MSHKTKRCHKKINVEIEQPESFIILTLKILERPERRRSQAKQRRQTRHLLDLYGGRRRRREIKQRNQFIFQFTFLLNETNIFNLGPSTLIYISISCIGRRIVPTPFTFGKNINKQNLLDRTLFQHSQSV